MYRVIAQQSPTLTPQCQGFAGQNILSQPSLVRLLVAYLFILYQILIFAAPRFLTTVVDDSSVMLNDVIDLLKDTELSKIDGPVLAMYDVKVAGEASSNAHTRQPPLWVPQQKRSIQAFAGARPVLGEEAAFLI